MSYNGSGTFNINSAGQPVVAGTVISATAFNALTADLGVGLSTAITKDGQTTTTARITFAQGVTSSLTTDSTSTSTGSIITAGGVGIAKALFVGTTANFAGVTTFSAGTVLLPAITTTGDTNTGIYFPAADTIAFTEGGAEAMRIDSSGNVGIGTNVPASKLNIVGDQLIVANGTTTSQLGIQIKGTSLNTLPTAQVQGYIATGDSGIGTAGDLLIAPRTDVGTSVRFITGTTPAERMRIDSSGNVGIGTSSPAYKLDSRVTTSASVVSAINLDASGNSNGDGSAITFSRAGNAVSVVARISAVKAEVSNNETDLVFSNWAAGVLTEKMRVVGATGNVGIGTVSPGVKLDVVGGTIRSSISGGTPIFYLSNGTTQHSIQNNSGSLAFYNDGTRRMDIDSSGNLLIGSTTNTTVSNLILTGATRWAVGTQSGGNIFYIVRDSDGVGQYMVQGSTSWTATSDERLKDIIEPITNAASKVSTLRAVIGKFKKDAEGTRRSFLIAQDVKAVLPEAVTVQEDEFGTLGIQYTEVIPLLVAAIKELKTENDSLKARLDAANL
jgi:hypothetical protein